MPTMQCQVEVHSHALQAEAGLGYRSFRVPESKYFLVRWCCTDGVKSSHKPARRARRTRWTKKSRRQALRGPMVTPAEGRCQLRRYIYLEHTTKVTAVATRVLYCR